MENTDLCGVTIFERDDEGELFCVWVYPTLSLQTKHTLLNKCTHLSIEHPSTTFLYARTDDARWYYVTKRQQQNNEKVKDFYMILISNKFNPELYESLGRELSDSYQATESTTPVLKQYLSMYTKSSSAATHAKDYPQNKAYLETCVKELIQLFGLEVILLYTGILLKRRIVVYTPKLSTLQHVCRTLPVFALHRRDWNQVYPHVTSLDEWESVKKSRAYVVGVTDHEMETKRQLYDLFVNVADGEITINPDSKEFFQLGKMHKEVAKHLVSCSQNEDMADEDIIKELNTRTKTIIGNLKELGGEQQAITLELLRERNLSTLMQAFLFNLAAAEGIVKMSL